MRPGNPVMPQAPKMSVPYPGQKPAVAKPPGAPGAAPAAPAPPAPAPAAPAPPRPPVVTAAPVAAPAPVPANVEAEVKQLGALFQQMKKQTFFEVLGVKKDADANAVKVAYFKLAKSYHPDTVPPGTPEALAKAKADIFALVGEANRVLSEPKLKADYLAEIEAGGTGEKVDVSKIFLAEELFQKGCILVKARKFPEAVKMLDDAIKANADEGEYYVWRGYAKFFGFSDRKFGQTEAMKDINYGLKKNPNVAAAHFFIGMMAKMNGDNAAAKKSFNQCVKMDPQHIDAQRELRMLK
jgi:curved DNA-binding protein CbpA